MSVDELGEYGMQRMTDDEIAGFLSSQRTGVLGLPTAGSPYLLPISYGYDGDSRLYFTYVLGASSRKESLSDSADRASFLVFSVDSMFIWESVLLEGTIDELPESEWDTALEALTGVWRPGIYEEAELSRGATIYAFDVEERSGVKHTAVPPGFEA